MSKIYYAVVALFLFFTIDLFINTFYVCKPKEKQYSTKLTFLSLWVILALSPIDTYSSVIMLLLDFSYIMLISTEKLGKKLVAFGKYEAYYFFGSFLIAALYTLLTMDLPIFRSDDIYAQYTGIIGNALLYIILSMYIITRKLSVFPSGKIYKRYFLTTTGITVALLVVCSMLLGSTIIKQEDMVPLLFTLLLLVTLLCISIYRRVITVLEESAHAKVEAEKYALQLDYQEQIEKNLKVLSTLRHDFKNHLIIISEYARKGNQEKLQSYISSIQQELTPTKLIDTPSDVISSLMNAKNETCKNKGVILNFTCAFRNVNIDDFHIVTILSNLLDNAITAAAKCEKGYINLSISECNSFLEITCFNNHQEQIVFKDGIYITTKKDARIIHGMGITSIRRAVKELRGETHIEHTADTFSVTILVPNH